MKNSAGKALVKSPRLRKSQQNAKEICQMYFMQLRSGLIIEKKTCYFRKETSKRLSPKRAGNYKEQHLLFPTCREHLEHHKKSAESFAFVSPMVQQNRTDDSNIIEHSVCLSTYNNQSIAFVLGKGGYDIYVECLDKKEKKDKVLFHYYDLQLSERETGDGVDGQKLMVRISPTENKEFLLHANNKEHSVKLQKCENSLPDQTFFLLHEEFEPSPCVSLECKSNPGVFLGIKDNHLALIDQTDHSRRENIKFKLS